MEQMAAARDQSTDDSVEAVRSGMNIRSDFWDDFIQLTGNAAALSVLLDVPKDKIAGWSQKIMDVLATIQQADNADPDGRAKTLPTGDGNG
jgi:hypothetical protein